MQCPGRDTRAIGGIAGELEGTLLVEIPERPADQRRHIGKHLSGNGCILIRREAEIIGYREADAVHRVKFDIGDQEAAAVFVTDRVRKARQGNHRQTENLYASPFVIDPFLDGIINHFHRLDLPARVFGTSILGDHRTGRIGGIVERKSPVGISFAAPRGESASVFQNEQEIVNGAVPQTVGQLYPVAIGDITIRADRLDIAFRNHSAGFSVPQHLVGTQLISVAIEDHIAFCRDQIILEIIVDAVGAEFDLLVLLVRRTSGIAPDLADSGRRCKGSQRQG